MEKEEPAMRAVLYDYKKHLTAILLTDIKITMWFMVCGNDNLCVTVLIFTEKILIMRHLLGSLLNTFSFS